MFSGWQGEGGAAPQNVGYHMPIGFYHRLWKGAGVGAGKEKGKGR